MHDIEVAQCKMLKSALGLNSYCRNTPLLQALNTQTVHKSTTIQELALFKSMFLSSSRCCKLYMFFSSKIQVVT